jgi:hypothetical protein
MGQLWRCVVFVSVVPSTISREDYGMASLEQRNGKYRVVFRYGGQKYTRSLRTTNEKAANLSVARLEDNLRRLELGTLVVPEDADVAAFLLSDGEPKTTRQAPKIRTLKKLCDAYFNSKLSSRSVDKLRIEREQGFHRFRIERD